MPKKRIGIFADVTHMFSVVQEKHAKKINYEKYLDKAIGNDHLYVAIAYGAQIDNEANGFIKRLQSFGYETKYIRAIPQPGSKIIDLSTSTDFVIEMTLDMIRYLKRIDTAVIGSIDIRLIPVIKFLQERGVKAHILACCIPNELNDIANKIIEIPDEILEKRRI